MSNDWSDIHEKYSEQGWVDLPSLFAQDILQYFPANSSILELGCGQGQDGRYFASHGHSVLSTDNEQSALEKAEAKVPNQIRSRLKIQNLDLSDLPFELVDESFDVVYAHLSLHYFDSLKTEKIFSEIHRVLKPGGILAFFVNSTSDPEYKQGELIETDYYRVDGMAKRYFSVQTAKDFATNFTPLVVDANGETYKDRAKGVHNLIRFIGRRS